MTKRTIGWILNIIGLFMLFKMVRVSSFGFYRLGGISTSAIILVLLIMSAVAVVISRNKFTYGCLILSLILLVVSLILGTNLHIAYSSLTDLLLVFVPIILGTGLIIKGSIEKRRIAKKDY